ncbi:MHYT domain-containing protein [Bermanella sp. R86510]|uniref:MHYT domain-containing protein n=1 Tax=unclassified Bermanella TaxID=2627862 RepID=UPI0037C98BB5
MIDWIARQFTIPPDSILIYGVYDPWLVGLSIFIAMFASFMGLQVASQAALTSSRKRRQSMLFVGSIALGGGIWTMHFIGMLAFELCTTVEYGWQLTLLSLFPGIGASWIALNYINHHQQGFKPLFIGGTLVGAGIGTMHYMGMAAMETAPLLRYNLAMFALSIVVAITLAMLSLWVRYGLAKLWKQSDHDARATLIASIVMGVAIAGMHYTGMAAARFVRPEGLELSNQSSHISTYLALGVASVTILMIGLVLGINLIYRYKDISQTAQENERRIRAMMNTAVDGIVTIDSHGTIGNINKATEKLLGWSPAELQGQNVKMLMPEPFRSEHDGYLQRYLKTGEARIIGTGREVEAVHKNGERIAIRLAIGHVKMAADDFFVAFITDIRQRLQMEQALRENEEKFRSLISNIPGIAYRCGDECHESMIFISDAVETITGYPANEFILPNPKRHFIDIVHPDDRQLFNQRNASQKIFHLEYRIIHKDDEIHWVMEQGSLVHNQQTGDVWRDGFIMDITERREMELALREAKEKAEQAAAARAAFMANMSHEIRTPMNAIIGFSDILLESMVESEQQRQLKTINQSAKSLLHLLNDILDSAKLEKGKLALEVRDFSLIQEVDAVVSTFWLQAHSKGLKLTADLSPKLAKHYSGSPERIRQVLTNLISNSVKFTEKGYVKISVYPIENQHVEFLIEDTGIGMSQEQVDKVFEPFTQADASMSRRFGGTGLGTTISKQLVELMEGKIEAKSEQGRGSQFRVILPLTPCLSAVSEQQIQRIHLPPMTILVVDDISQNIELLTIMLKRDGHTVLNSRDGQQALVRMSTEKNIDLVLMDLQMPVMDGLAASRERRRLEHTNKLKHLPIIALTASVLADDQNAAKAAGMDGFANKPIDPLQLNKVIAEVLNIDIEEHSLAQSEPEHGKMVDEARGIALWGSKEDYYQQLEYFVSKHKQDFEQLKEYCNTNDWRNLQSLAHTLKGICGNLSLTCLMRTLEKVESILQSHPSQCEDLINDIHVYFDQVDSKVKDYKANKADSSTSVLVDTAELSPLLLKIKNAAEHNEIEEALLQRLLEYEQTSMGPVALNIYNAINDFEFTQAMQLIEQLLQTLSVESGG